MRHTSVDALSQVDIGQVGVGDRYRLTVFYWYLPTMEFNATGILGYVVGFHVCKRQVIDGLATQ